MAGSRSSGLGARSPWRLFVRLVVGPEASHVAAWLGAVVAWWDGLVRVVVLGRPLFLQNPHNHVAEEQANDIADPPFEAVLRGLLRRDDLQEDQRQGRYGERADYGAND